MMARIAATRSIVVFVVVVVSSFCVLSLARRTIDPLPSDAEGSASSLQALASPTLLLLLPRGKSDPSVADQDPDKRADLEAAKPLPAAAEDDDPTALAVADRRLRPSSLLCLLGGCGDEEIEAPRRGGCGGDAAALPAAEEEEEEAERAVAGAEANRRSAEVMGRIPKEEDGAKEKEGERAKKKPWDSDSDSDSDSDDDEEEEDEVEVEGKRKKKKEKKEKGGFLKWFWTLVNRF